MEKEEAERAAKDAQRRREQEEIINANVTTEDTARDLDDGRF